MTIPRLESLIPEPLRESLFALRRDLHQYPELAFQGRATPLPLQRCTICEKVSRKYHLSEWTQLLNLQLNKQRQVLWVSLPRPQLSREICTHRSLSDLQAGLLYCSMPVRDWWRKLSWVN